MTQEEWDQLVSMRHQISNSGLTAFNSLYLERYTELLAKSLEGKGDEEVHSNSVTIS
jgi:hypothetical protein